MTKKTLPAVRRGSDVIALEKDMKAANKAADAVRRSPEYRDRQNRDVAEALTAFSKEVGSDTMAAQLLGFGSKRTFDNAKQGRGFANPVMLFLALQAFKGTEAGSRRSETKGRKP
ncbi:MAG: hypothetical protein KIS96_14400 [Bauldia sp.]|nr:hypothetical protein [Bauldia sp.]